MRQGVRRCKCLSGRACRPAAALLIGPAPPGAAPPVQAPGALPLLGCFRSNLLVLGLKRDVVLHQLLGVDCALLDQVLHPQRCLLSLAGHCLQRRSACLAASKSAPTQRSFSFWRASSLLRSWFWRQATSTSPPIRPPPHVPPWPALRSPRALTHAI